MCRQPFLLKIHTHSGIPHYNDLKMLYAVYPLHNYTSPSVLRFSPLLLYSTHCILYPDILYFL